MSGCTCRKHIGIGTGGQRVGGWWDQSCAEHHDGPPPWMQDNEPSTGPELCRCLCHTPGPNVAHVVACCGWGEGELAQ
jgi:hypothetical protein